MVFECDQIRVEFDQIPPLHPQVAVLLAQTQNYEQLGPLTRVAGARYGKS